MVIGVLLTAKTRKFSQRTPRTCRLGKKALWMIGKKMYIWRVIFKQKQEKHLLYMKNKRYKIEKVAYSWVL